MPKKYPRVKFIIASKQDASLVKWGMDSIEQFLPKNMRFICEENFSKNERKKIVAAYVKHYYKINRDKINASIKETENKWKKYGKTFFKLTDKIFKNYPWPKGNYRGHVSIWSMYPRDMGRKLFALPMHSSEPLYIDFDLLVIAHEMLHFITYDYLQKKYHLKPSECNDHNNFFWQFTENLNVLIENSKMWRTFSSGFISQPYDNCAVLYQKMEKIWRKSQDLDNLIVKTFKLEKIKY